MPRPNPPRKQSRAALFAGLVLIVGLLMMYEVKHPSTPRPPAPRAEEAGSPPAQENPTERPDWRRDIKLVKSRVAKGGFGTVAIWTVTLRNLSEKFSYSDFRYGIAYSGASGTVVDAAMGTLYSRLQPGETHTFRNVNAGFVDSQAADALFRIVGARNP